MAAQGFTLCFCDLRDCIFYQPDPGNDRKCRCEHPEKPHYMSQLACPLYKMDWQKKLKAAAPPAKPKRMEQDF